MSRGKNLAEHCRNEYSRGPNFILWFIAEIAIVAADIPEVIGTSFALNMLFNIPVWIGVILTRFSTLILLALQQYGVMLHTVGAEMQVVNKSETSISLQADDQVVLTPD